MSRISEQRNPLPAPSPAPAPAPAPVVKTASKGRKFKVLAEMLGNHRGMHEDGRPNEVDGGYKRGDLITADDLRLDVKGMERLVEIGAIEPFILMIPAPDQD